MRKKIVIGNWKMNYTVDAGEEFLESIVNQINVTDVDVVVCPSFVSLDRFSNILYDTNICLGAQNVHFAEKGTYTGEISCSMLDNIGVKYCIVGHSERRTLLDEKNDFINSKVKSLVSHDLKPILCVGESLEERESGKSYDVVKEKVVEGLKDVSGKDLVNKVIIAYEPIWAISKGDGKGKVATKEDADDMCKFIRGVVAELYDENAANNIRILYGGSVNLTNVKDLFAMENIDGGLIGGASLKNDFIGIVNYND